MTEYSLLASPTLTLQTALKSHPAVLVKKEPFNARKFIANFKQQKYTHFFKFQYDTITAQILPHLPAELEAEEQEEDDHRLKVMTTSPMMTMTPRL
jgi:hypothetical protein